MQPLQLYSIRDKHTIYMCTLEIPLCSSVNPPVPLCLKSTIRDLLLKRSTTPKNTHPEFECVVNWHHDLVYIHERSHFALAV
jgi:hypothetical protein